MVPAKGILDIDWERNFPPLVFIIHGCILVEIVSMMNAPRNVTKEILKLRIYIFNLNLKM